jgi:hypothetical protein
MDGYGMREEEGTCVWEASKSAPQALAEATPILLPAERWICTPFIVDHSVQVLQVVWSEKVIGMSSIYLIGS